MVICVPRDKESYRNYMKNYMAHKRQMGLYKTIVTPEIKEQKRVRQRVLRLIEMGKRKIDEKYFNYLWIDLSYKDYPKEIDDIRLRIVTGKQIGRAHV